MGVALSVKLSRGDRRDANLLDQEPRQLKVAWAASHVGREGVVLGELHLGHVDKQEISTLGVGDGQVELLKDLLESINLALHLLDRLVPEAVGGSLFEADGRSLLEGCHGGEADAGVGGRDVLNELRGANQPA